MARSISPIMVNVNKPNITIMFGHAQAYVSTHKDSRIIRYPKGKK